MRQDPFFAQWILCPRKKEADDAPIAIGAPEVRILLHNGDEMTGMGELWA